MGALNHDGLLVLARRVSEASRLGNTERVVRDTERFLQGLVHHINRESLELRRLSPADARLLRRGQTRVLAIARAALRRLGGLVRQH